jgi:hypothetical protein
MIYHLNNRRKEKLESFVSISIIIRFLFFYTLIRSAEALHWQCSSAPLSTVNKISFFGQVSVLYTFFRCPWNESFFLVPQVPSTNVDTLYTEYASEVKFIVFSIISKGGLRHSIYSMFYVKSYFRSDS